MGTYSELRIGHPIEPCLFTSSGIALAFATGSSEPDAQRKYNEWMHEKALSGARDIVKQIWNARERSSEAFGE
jgi:hypothetical protein